MAAGPEISAVTTEQCRCAYFIDMWYANTPGYWHLETCSMYRKPGKSPTSLSRKVKEAIVTSSFEGILQELLDLHIAKRSSYGTDEDPLANYRYAKSMGYEAYEATSLRMNEKWLRYQNLYRKRDIVAMREELRDIAVIAVITMGLLDEEVQRANVGQ